VRRLPPPGPILALLGPGTFSSGGHVRVAACALLLLVFSGAALLAPMFRTLDLGDPEGGRPFFRAPMWGEEEFEICFIHSVNQRPVCDRLRVEGDHLLILGSRFDSFGAGMPDGSTGEGVLRRLSNGWLEWKVHRPVSQVILRVGRTAQHRLVVKGKEIPLSQLARPGQALSLRPGRACLWEIIWQLGAGSERGKGEGDQGTEQ
jgi:hypothetical protein